MKLWKKDLIVLICATAMTFAACGGESDNDANNNTNVNNIDKDKDHTATETAVIQFRQDLSEALEQHYCHIAMTCAETPTHLVEMLSRYKNVEGCLDSGFMDPTLDSFEPEITAIKAGRLKFDAAKAAECISAIEKASTTCDFDAFLNDDIHVPSACDDTFVAQQDDAEECLNYNECLSGSCTSAWDVCELGTCEKSSEAPIVVGEGDDCAVNTCGEGLFCNYQIDPETDDTTTACAKIEIVNKGEQCDEYAGKLCAENLVCNGVCDDAPTLVNEGEECDSYYTYCKIGFTCLETDDVSTCAPHSAKGGPCIYTENCQPGLWCEIDEETAAGTCAELLELGQPCHDQDACGHHAFCDDLSDEATCITYDDGNDEICAM